MDESASTKRIWIGLLTFAGLIAAGMFAYVYVKSQSDLALYTKAYNLLYQNKFAEAEQIAQKMLKREENAAALILAADVARFDGRIDDALGYYQKLPDEATDDYLQQNLVAGGLAREAGRASLAERFFRNVLKAQRHHQDACKELGLLLVLEGRRWEAADYLLQSVRQRNFTITQLIMLGDFEQPFCVPADIEKYRQTDPDDKVPLLGLARLAIDANQRDEAERLLREVLAARPDLIEAQAWLGWVLADQGEKFVEWQKGLPAKADEHPVVWMARGVWATQQNQPRAAIRCYWETVRLDPNHRVANERLGQLLAEQGSPEEAKLFSMHAGRLNVLRSMLSAILVRSHDPSQLKGHAEKFGQVANLLVQLGRLWEANAWLMVTGKIEEEPPPWLLSELEKLEPQLTKELPAVEPSANPANQIDLSTYPLPNWDELSPAPMDNTGEPAK